MSIELFTNAIISTLVDSISNSVTTLTVISAASFPSTGNFRIVIDTEIMKVTAVSGNVLTVVRGSEGTTAVTHISGSIVTVILTAAALAAFRFDSIGFDTVANRPAAGSKGRLYFPSDGNGSGAIDTGAAWQPFGLSNFPLVVPVATDFSTTVGSGSDTFTQNGDCIVHTMNGNQNKGRLKTLTLDKTYTVQMSPMFAPITSVVTFCSVGLVIRDSATGNTRLFGFTMHTNAIRVFEVASMTGASSFGNPTTVLSYSNANFPSVPLFQRIFQPSSGNRVFSFSIDGQNWTKFRTEAWNSVVANPNQVGFVLQSNTTGTFPVGNIIRSYQET